MAEYGSLSETRRPVISVLVVRGKDIDLQAVFWGMEEEGIPFEVQEWPTGEAVGVAKEAAMMSPLNVGIGVDPARGAIVLHHRDLPADQPLFVLNLREVGNKELRRLGVNAARLVKSEPLVLKDEPETTHTPVQSRAEPEVVSDELVEQIVKRILAEMAKV